MLNLTQNMIKALHSNRKVSFRYDLLNFDEVKIGELQGEDGNINLSSLAQIKRRGKFNFKENELNDIDWLNDRVRPIFILNDTYEWPLGNFIISAPTRAARRDGIFRTVDAYDSTLVLREDKFITRHRIPKDYNYITAIEQLINSAGVWRLDITPSDLTLKTDREFEIGTTKLEAVNSLLQEINYTSVWADYMGTLISKPYVLPTDREVEYTYSNNDISIIKADSTTEELDLFEVPNIWVIVASNPETDVLSSTWTNDSAGSPTSTIRRRRNIVDYRQIEDIASQQVLDDYVKRLAYEGSNTFGKFIFNTAIMPHHSYMDSLFCDYSKLGIKNKYIETSWEMDLRAGGTMTHTARRVIQI